MRLKNRPKSTWTVKAVLAAFGLCFGLSLPSAWARSPSPLPSFDPDTQAFLCSQVALNWRGLADQCELGLSQLIQESGLNPHARSGVGAEGLGQFMPGTWAEVVGQLGLDPFTPRFDVRAGIEAYTYYQGKLDYAWRKNRTPLEAHRPGLASYNAGMGSVLKAQTKCANAPQWDGMAPCMVQVTGEANAKQTTDYVVKIFARWLLLQGGH